MTFVVTAALPGCEASSGMHPTGDASLSVIRRCGDERAPRMGVEKEAPEMEKNLEVGVGNLVSSWP
jgi:hypothetical protein